MPTSSRGTKPDIKAPQFNRLGSEKLGPAPATSMRLSSNMPLKQSKSIGDEPEALTVNKENPTQESESCLIKTTKIVSNESTNATT